MNDFLPEGYNIPSQSNYMRFKPGANKFRILTSPILGYEWWVDRDGGRRPERVPMNGRIPVQFADEYKHFWAMVVWNYQENKIQILEITQKGIMNAIKALAADDSWGNPKEYDLTVTREGEGFDTEYMIMPNKPTSVPKEALEALKSTQIRLEALYEGNDPFQPVTTDSEDFAEDAANALN